MALITDTNIQDVLTQTPTSNEDITARLYSELREAGINFDFKKHYGRMVNLSKNTGSKFSVYKTQRPDGTFVAVKLKKAETEDIARNNVREIAILRFNVNRHPHVIHMRGVNMTPKNELYMEMELHPKTLSNEIYSHKEILPMSYIKTIICDLLRALYYCHSNSVLHADVKPMNILISSEDRAILTDFDASVVIPPPPQMIISSNVNAGGYKSPEVCLMQPFTFSPDLWALGCTIDFIFHRENSIFCSQLSFQNPPSFQNQLDTAHLFAGPFNENMFYPNNSENLRMPTGQVHAFETIFPNIPSGMVPFFKSLLEPNQYFRATALVALSDPFLYAPS